MDFPIDVAADERAHRAEDHHGVGPTIDLSIPSQRRGAYANHHGGQELATAQLVDQQNGPPFHFISSLAPLERAASNVMQRRKHSRFSSATAGNLLKQKRQHHPARVQQAYDRSEIGRFSAERPRSARRRRATPTRPRCPPGAAPEYASHRHRTRPRRRRYPPVPPAGRDRPAASAGLRRLHRDGNPGCRTAGIQEAWQGVRDKMKTYSRSAIRASRATTRPSEQEAHTPADEDQQRRGD